MKENIILKDITTATLENIPDAITTALNAYNSDKSKANAEKLDKAVKDYNAGIAATAYNNTVISLTADGCNYGEILKTFALTLVQVYKITYNENQQAELKVVSKALNFAKAENLYRKDYYNKLIENGKSKKAAAEIAELKTLFKNPDVLHMLEKFTVNILNFKAKESEIKIKYVCKYKARHPEKMMAFTGTKATTSKGLFEQLNAIKNAMGFVNFNFNRSDMRFIVDALIIAKVNDTNDGNYIAGRIAKLVNLIFVAAKKRINDKDYNIEVKEDTVITAEDAKKSEQKKGSTTKPEKPATKPATNKKTPDKKPTTAATTK